MTIIHINTLNPVESLLKKLDYLSKDLRKEKLESFENKKKKTFEKLKKVNDKISKISLEEKKASTEGSLYNVLLEKKLNLEKEINKKAPSGFEGVKVLAINEFMKNNLLKDYKEHLLFSSENNIMTLSDFGVYDEEQKSKRLSYLFIPFYHSHDNLKIKMILNLLKEDATVFLLDQFENAEESDLDTLKGTLSIEPVLDNDHVLRKLLCIEDVDFVVKDERIAEQFSRWKLYSLRNDVRLKNCDKVILTKKYESGENFLKTIHFSVGNHYYYFIEENGQVSLSWKKDGKYKRKFYNSTFRPSGFITFFECLGKKQGTNLFFAGSQEDLHIAQRLLFLGFNVYFFLIQNT
jgi:hypothetical protein